ncbi:MAG: DUF2721 domain-containing protein, partial [Methylobacterium ajmalii]
LRGKRGCSLRHGSILSEGGASGKPGAVHLVALAGFLTGIAAMVLFIGELRNATTETVLYGCFGLALAFTIAAIAGFLCEILMASRSIRLEVGHQQDTAVAAAD